MPVRVLVLPAEFVLDGLVLEFPLEFMLLVLPIFPLVFELTVAAGSGVDIVDELLDIVLELVLVFLAFEFVFVLLSAPHPSMIAETVKHRPVASSFLIFYLSSQELF